MVTLTKIYTKGGDRGQTSLGDGSRVAKHDLRVAAYGTVDEANATIGLARLHTGAVGDAMLARIQNDLFDLGADLCRPGADAEDARALRIQARQVTRLEDEIDALNVALKPLGLLRPAGRHPRCRLPPPGAHGGAPGRAPDNQARDRRGRSIPRAVRYLNRLSDHLFVLARYLNDKGAGDVLWVPGANR